MYSIYGTRASCVFLARLCTYSGERLVNQLALLRGRCRRAALLWNFVFRGKDELRVDRNWQPTCLVTEGRGHQKKLPDTGLASLAPIICFFKRCFLDFRRLYSLSELWGVRDGAYISVTRLASGGQAALMSRPLLCSSAHVPRCFHVP